MRGVLRSLNTGKRSRYMFPVLLLSAVLLSLLLIQEILASNPPLISNVRIVEIDNDSALIEWSTDKDADSLIDYGLNRGYGQAREPGGRTEHSVLLDNLLSGTTYHFRVISRDPEGNQGISSDYIFTTEGVSEVVDMDQAVADRVEQVIQDITDIDELVEAREAIDRHIQELSDELTIIGTPQVEVSENNAIVRWSTNRQAMSEVRFESQANFDESAPQYSRSQTGGGLTMEHEVQLEGLTPATTYHFIAVSEDNAGVEARSVDHTFTTDALTPNIQNVELVHVGEDSATLEWSTSVPAESLVQYENVETGEMSNMGSPTLSTNHTVRLTNLEFGATYRATVIAIGEDGGITEGNPIEFETVINEDPPIVTNVSTESTLFPGTETRVQTIVTWRTSELAVCRFNYQEGLAPGADVFDIDPRDSSFMIEHVQVVTAFRQATVYQFWFICEDRFGNEGESEKFVIFTPQQERNIIDIIMENFEATFGWVGNLTN